MFKKWIVLPLACSFAMVALAQSTAINNNNNTTYNVTIKNSATSAIVISSNTGTTGVSLQAGILPQALVLNASGTKTFIFATGVNGASTRKIALNACESVTSGNNSPCQNTSSNSYICTFSASNSTGMATANVNPSTNNGLSCTARIVGININFTVSGTATN